MYFWSSVLYCSNKKYQQCQVDCKFKVAMLQIFINLYVYTNHTQLHTCHSSVSNTANMSNTQVKSCVLYQFPLYSDFGILRSQIGLSLRYRGSVKYHPDFRRSGPKQALENHRRLRTLIIFLKFVPLFQQFVYPIYT